MNARARRKALPALAASLRWYKRAIIRMLQRRALELENPRLREYTYDKIRKIRAKPPHALRDSYICDRVGEIRRAPLAELRTVVPSLVLLRAA